MSKYKVGFIGCGNMGSALATAVSKQHSFELIAVCDNDEKKVKAVENRNIATAKTFESVTENSEMIFVAVKPQVLKSVLSDMAPILKKRNDRYVIVSMAAGVSVADIEKFLGFPCPIIRIMPNTPVAVGQGMILYCNNQLVTDKEIKVFNDALAFAGKSDAIEEGKIDAAAALSGCGPAFVYLFGEALADGAVECGLPRDKAQLYAAQTLLGAAEMLLNTGKTPGELKDAVCSPGGTTIAGVHALEDGKLRATAMNAVTAAYKRTAELLK